MFVCINFYFRPYEFLCLSLSFSENTVSILYIEEVPLRYVKIVSVLSSIFISENVSVSAIMPFLVSSRSLPLC